MTGLCFKVHKKLGRFCREIQYASEYEELLKQVGLAYQRELEIKSLNPDSPRGNKVDFIIAGRLLVDFKAKNYVTKDDYFQMKRYLKGANLELGLIVNFREAHLKPKRVLNSDFLSGRSDVNSENSDRINNKAI